MARDATNETGRSTPHPACAMPYAGEMGAGAAADQWIKPGTADPGSPWYLLPTLH